METNEKLIERVRRLAATRPYMGGIAIDVAKVVMNGDDRDELCNRLEATTRLVFDHGDGTSTSLPAVPAPSPATVDVGEALKLVDDLAQQLGNDAPGYRLEVGGRWTVKQGLALLATVRSLTTALSDSERKVAGLEADREMYARVAQERFEREEQMRERLDAATDAKDAAEALAREAGQKVAVAIDALEHIEFHECEMGRNEGPSRGFAQCTLAKLRPITTEKK